MFVYYFLIFATCILTFTTIVYYALYLKEYKFSSFLLTTIAAILTINMIFAIENIKGQPSEVIPDDFKVIYWIEANPIIYLWITEDSRNYPYTLIIPWSRETAQQLSESEESIRNGLLGGTVEKQSGLFESIEFYEMPPNQVLPKE